MRHCERALRVGGGGVDAERDDERARSGRERGRLAHRGEPRLVAGAGRDRQVEVRLVVLGREPEEVGEPARARVDVHRRSPHVVAPAEELLRPVAVVRVDVDDRDRAADALEQRRRRDRRVVQVARAAVSDRVT